MLFFLDTLVYQESLQKPFFLTLEKHPPSQRFSRLSSSGVQIKRGQIDAWLFLQIKNFSPKERVLFLPEYGLVLDSIVALYPTWNFASLEFRVAVFRDVFSFVWFLPFCVEVPLVVLKKGLFDSQSIKILIFVLRGLRG